jgi:hypothetical protein
MGWYHDALRVTHAEPASKLGFRMAKFVSSAAASTVLA